MDDYMAALEPGRGILIGGRWRAGDKVFTVEDPASRAVIAEVADASPADATRAAEAAGAAFLSWRSTSPRERSDLLARTFELMLRDREMLAGLISLENGKSLDDARAEVTYAAEFFRWFAEEAVRTGGDYGSSPAGGTRTMVHHRPVGVALLVTPWNFPAAMATRKLAPALAAGCTVVLKPAAETPLTAMAVARLFEEAGAPDGVVNLVPTTDPGAVVGTLLSDSRVRKISFTGSTRIGTVLLRQAAERVVNASMELGGNAPFVVTGDADIEAAVSGLMLAKFRNGGQACTAANRLYVHEDVAERFTARLAEKVDALTVGSAAEGHMIGPLISASAVDRLGRLIADAVAGGARIVTQAQTPHSKGYFFPPTVLADVPEDAPLLNEELFGPVAPIVAWRDEEDLIANINRSEMGLAGYVYAGDLAHALRLGEALEVGMVGINRGLVSDPAAPFGGMKSSGLGREGARVGLEEFQETQYFSVDWA